MCGRYALTISELKKRFNAGGEIDKFSSNNICPGSDIPVVVQKQTGVAVTSARWGFHPQWAKSASQLLINARAETVADKTTFKQMLKESRCLIPATAFYEWGKINSKKLPHRFTPLNDQIFAMAGLINYTARQPEALILTVPATGLVSNIHERSPLILSPESENDWLSGKVIDYRLLAQIKDLKVQILDSITV